jgi:hypothetical protein
MRGFTRAGNGTGSGGGRGNGGRRDRKKIELYPDPTYLEGHEHVIAEQGKTKAVRFELNATDTFFEADLGQLSVRCTNPRDRHRRDRDRRGSRRPRARARQLPKAAKLGEFDNVAGIYDWERSSGGLGGSLDWQVRFEVVDEVRAAQPPRNGQSKSSTVEGPQVALVWNPDQEVGLTPANPGKVEKVPAKVLAAALPEYAELAALGDKPVLTIYLNDDYSPSSATSRRANAN